VVEYDYTFNSWWNMNLDCDDDLDCDYDLDCDDDLDLDYDSVAYSYS
jgi:hypothetical protein